MDAFKELDTIANKISDIAFRLKNYSEDLKTAPPNELAVFYFKLKITYDRLDTARKEVYHCMDYINKSVFPERLEALGVEKIAVPEIERSFYTVTKYSASILDKEGAMKWLRNRGDGALIQETVNASSLMPYLKDMVIREGIDAPPELFKFSSYATTGISKYKPKKT